MEDLINRLKRCDYCRKTLEPEQSSSRWDDHHPNDHHYVMLKCECGHENWVKTDFQGSGHNHWLHREFTPVSSTFRKVRER